MFVAYDRMDLKATRLLHFDQDYKLEFNKQFSMNGTYKIMFKEAFSESRYIASIVSYVASHDHRYNQ